MQRPENQDRTVARTRLRLSKTCISCHVAKPAKDFYVYKYTTAQGKQSSRLEGRCKDCARKRRRKGSAEYQQVLASARAWKSKNRDKLHPTDRQLMAMRPLRVASEQKRRAAKSSAQSTATGKDIRAVLEMARVGSQYLDAYTGELIDDPTIDHIIPLASDGAHSALNMCVTSRFNNTSKHKTPMLVWLVKRLERQRCRA